MPSAAHTERLYACQFNSYTGSAACLHPSLLEVEGCLDIGLQVGGQDVRASGVEGFGDGSGSASDQVADGVGKLELSLGLHFVDEFALEGLTVDQLRLE